MTDIFERSLIIHEQLRGKIGVVGKMPITSRDDLSLAYTPVFARPCEVIASDPCKAHELTIKRNSVAVVCDGSAVLGLGNIGPHAAIPVIEGKSAPRCFAVEQALQDIGIPVFHDGQHGTAIVLLAALINAAKVLSRDITQMKVVIGVSKGNLLSSDDISRN